MPSSRGSSQPRDWTQVSYLLLHWQASSLPLAPAEKPTSTILQFKKCFVIAKTGFDKWKFVWGKKEFDPQKTWVRGLLGGSDMPEQGGAIGGCTRLSEKLAEHPVWEQVWIKQTSPLRNYFITHSVSSIFFGEGGPCSGRDDLWVLLDPGKSLNYGLNITVFAQPQDWRKCPESVTETSVV